MKKNKPINNTEKRTSYNQYKRKMNLAMAFIFLFYGIVLIIPKKIAVTYATRFGEVRTTNPPDDNIFNFIIGLLIIIISSFFIKKFWK